MRVVWFILFMLISTTAYASNVAVCEPTDPLVPNRVSAYRKSVHTPDWDNGINLINPDLTPVQGVIVRYWKCDSGALVEMTQTEKDTLDAPRIAQQARRQTFIDEVSLNDLCDAELSDIDTRIDAGVNGITNLSSAKTFMRKAFKKVARCLKALNETGGF